MMNLLRFSRSNATVVVGLDFGTTFSGFAYALTSKPEECQLFYEWPGLEAAGASNYCKNQTSLLYSDVPGECLSSESYILQGWGYEALVQHAQGRQSEQTTLRVCSDVKRTSKSNFAIKADTSGVFGHFVTRFKLHLARSVLVIESLEKMNFSMMKFSMHGRHILTVIISFSRKNIRSRSSQGTHSSENYFRLSEEAVRAHYQRSSEKSWKSYYDGRYSVVHNCTCNMGRGSQARDQGMRRDSWSGRGPTDENASPHPVLIVLEPEAASFYCQQKSDYPLNDGDKFLVVDAGGGTVDLALHEKAGPPWSMKVREVAPSSGGLCGGTYVDEGFFQFLSQKIKCFRKFAEEQPQTILNLLSWWESIKREFDGNMRFGYELDLPTKLARAWEEGEAFKNAIASYDSISLTLDDMLSIFDPVVDQILQVIDDQFIPDLKAMMIVGGFSASPYLRKRIKAVFSNRLAPGTIIFPMEPGSAICCGAVAYGVGGPDLVMSRIAKKTYGIRIVRGFRQGDPAHFKFVHGNGCRLLCSHVFQAFMKKGETVPVDYCVTHGFAPIHHLQTMARVTMFSSYDADPAYVTDPGVREEGSFVVHHPSESELGKTPHIKVSMYFGRTTIEVKAEGDNFGEGDQFVMLPVAFERSFERMSLTSN